MTAASGSGQPFDSWGSSPWVPEPEEVTAVSDGSDSTDLVSAPTPTKVSGLNVGEGGWLFAHLNLLFTATPSDSDLNSLYLGTYLNGVALDDSKAVDIPAPQNLSADWIDDIEDLESEWGQVCFSPGATSGWLGQPNADQRTRGRTGAVAITNGVFLSPLSVIVPAGNYELEIKYAKSDSGDGQAYIAEPRLTAWTVSY